MKIAYVCGPFRAPNAWEVEQNIRRAEEVALELWRMGYAVICPHANTRFFNGAAEDKIWLEGDKELLRRSDIVVMVSDRQTAGVIEERIEAARQSIPAYMWPNVPTP